MTTPKTEAGRKLIGDLWGAEPEGEIARSAAQEQWWNAAIFAIEQEAGRLAVSEALSVERIYAALDGVLPHMAFERYGQFYNDDPYFNVADYIERLAIEVRTALSPEQPEVTE